MGLIFIQAPPSPRGWYHGYHGYIGVVFSHEASETLALMASGRQADILQRMIPALFHGNQKAQSNSPRKFTEKNPHGLWDLIFDYS